MEPDPPDPCSRLVPQAPRRILDEDVTVRLSSCSDTIVLQTPPVPPRAAHGKDGERFLEPGPSVLTAWFPSGAASADPHYERVFLLDPQYQNPAVLRNKLPELSQSAEASGERQEARSRDRT